MPNWCMNTINISGSAKELKKFDEQFQKEYVSYTGSTTTCRKEQVNHEELKNSYIEYRVCPYNNPFATEESRNELVEINGITGKTKEKGYSFNNFVPMTKEDYLNSWYNWSIENWGTKWDLHEISDYGLEDVEKAIAENKGDDELQVSYYFDTAWSPCSPVVVAMSKQFPNLSFEHAYEEDGEAYAGIDTYEAGECIKELHNEDGKIREFLEKHFGREYYKCAECGELLEEWDFEEEQCCPECNSKRIYDYDGETLVELKDEN